MRKDMKPEQRVKELTQGLNAATFENAAAVEAFYRQWMELVWDYKIAGKLFDYYDPHIVVERENGDNLVGIQAVVQDVINMQAAFPDLDLHVEAVVCIGDEQSGYELFARRYMHGTSLGYSKYGPPTGKELGEECMSLDMLRFKKVNGRWTIVEARMNQSIRTVRVAMGGPLELA